MTHVMYEIPSDESVVKVIITKQCVTDQCEPILERESAEGA